MISPRNTVTRCRSAGGTRRAIQARTLARAMAGASPGVRNMEVRSSDPMTTKVDPALIASARPTAIARLGRAARRLRVSSCRRRVLPIPAGAVTATACAPRSPSKVCAIRSPSMRSSRSRPT